MQSDGFCTELALLQLIDLLIDRLKCLWVTCLIKFATSLFGNALKNTFTVVIPDTDGIDLEMLLFGFIQCDMQRDTFDGIEPTVRRITIFCLLLCFSNTLAPR